MEIAAASLFTAIIIRGPPKETQTETAFHIYLRIKIKVVLDKVIGVTSKVDKDQGKNNRV